ncbi:MAG: hypothetical protein QOI13_2041 [Paraburkholderia sp.]|jgi:uncharacterized membrane protein|nr:hypothetical protein [Paraburkholderia sp.]
MKPAGQAVQQTPAVCGSHGRTARGAFAICAAAALVALIVLALLWEKWLAPLRPGGSALVFKALPLAFALPGVLRRRLYTFQWASMLILLYVAEGVVRGMTDARPSAQLGWVETALAVLFLACSLAYVAPFKRAAKAARPHATKFDAAETPASGRPPL